jgi:hypothetical protein
MWTSQYPRPLHAPFHRTKRHPGAACADNRTALPRSNAWLHSPGHRIPGGRLVTVPLPSRLTLRVSLSLSNAAPTVLGPSRVIVHVGEAPRQAPLHPENRELAQGVAERTTTVPWSKLPEHA